MIVKNKPEKRGAKSRGKRKISDNNLQIRMVSDAKEPNTFRSVYRTSNILTCICNGINSIADITNTCRLNKSTVYRLLRALSDARFITRDPISRRYHIGPLIAEIASNPFIAHTQLTLCAINEMRSLSRFSGEGIGLNVLIGLQNVSVLGIPSTYDLQIIVKNKIIDNLHAGASSKTLLSQLGAKELKIVMKNIVLDPITEHTITSKKELTAQLKQIRKQGYAIDYGERFNGAIHVSVPIKGYLLPATLSILGPDIRVKPRINDFIKKLKASSHCIQENIRDVFKLG